MIRKMVVGFKIDKSGNRVRERFDVYIGRPSKWGNPFAMKSEQDRAGVIEKYTAYLDRKIEAGELDPTELAGKVLGCWCAPRPCHGDVLARYANR